MMMEMNSNSDVPDEVTIKRTQEPVACGVWFTSSGKMMPLSLKFKDSEGNMLIINNIRVIKKEKKRFCGIPTMEFWCSTLMHGREYQFRLYHYPEDGCWKIAWNC